MHVSDVRATTLLTINSQGLAPGFYQQAGMPVSEHRAMRLGRTNTAFATLIAYSASSRLPLQQHVERRSSFESTKVPYLMTHSLSDLPLATHRWRLSALLC